MNIKGILFISFILLVLSLATVSASDLDHVAISDSHCDSSIAHVPVTVSSHDDSVVIDNLHDVAVDDSSIDDGQSVPADDSTIDDGGSSSPDDKKDSSADVDGDINDGDSIIINITNDTPKNNYNDKPISNVKEESGSFDDLQSLIDQSPKGTHLFLSRDYKGAKDQQVLINKDLVIEGQGHTMDCASVCRAIYSSSGNIVLRNLNIINGHYDTSCADDKTNNGGAICIGGKAKYTIENCNFTNNWADDNGGAIYNGADLALDIINCVFKGNAVDDVNGGAVYSVGDVNVKNSTFINNCADDNGGAICCARVGTTLKIINCAFEKNTADDLNGGAVYSVGDVLVKNSTFINNCADDSGGAIYNIYSGSTLKIINCIFEKNTVDDLNGGAVYSVGDVLVKNSTFGSNQADDSGGAIYYAAEKSFNIINCLLKNNLADDCFGGAVYSKGDVHIDNSTFNYNSAYRKGGAIEGSSSVFLTNCTFNNNKVDGIITGDAYGGAIYAFNDLYVNKCTFDSNYADDFGGAIYVEGDLYINYYQDDGANYNTFFKGNIADDYSAGAINCLGVSYIKNAVFDSNKAWIDGGAIYLQKISHITHCLFDSNKCAGSKFPCRGGAVNSETNLNIKNCILKNNYAEDEGGAIYCNSNVKIDNSTLEGNRADDDGGAIYTNRSVMINELTPHCKSHFINNKVSNDDGGAIYAVDSVNAYDAEFYSNSALLDGGAIYSNVVVLENCTFDSNRAEGAVHKCYGGAVRTGMANVIYCVFRQNFCENHGGAIFTNTFSGPVKYCTFYFNQAREDGGAIYINDPGHVTFTQCVFKSNHCDDEGGAIYLDSFSSAITIAYNFFMSNSAHNGHAVFNKGTYTKICNNWWGGANPSHDNYMLVEYFALSSNENRIDSDPLRMVMDCPSTLTVGKVARATLYFVKSDGSIFTGEIPLIMEFVLPSEYNVVSSGTTLNSIWIDFTPEKAGKFTISGDLLGQLVNVTSTVTEHSSFAGNSVASGFANANSRIVKNASLNTKFAKSLGDFPQSHGGFSIYAVELLILSIFGLQYC